MFNDDVHNLMRGLFHYNEFYKKGFSKSPTTHYFRPFYNYFYWVGFLVLSDRQSHMAGPICLNGRLVQAEFADLWRQFEHRYRDKCHFGFSFVSRFRAFTKIYPFSLTHEDTPQLALMDEKLDSMLGEMEAYAKNTVLIIMGDHGQRLSDIKKTHSGRIEERMPHFSVRMPREFQKHYPKDYANLVRNQWTLTRFQVFFGNSQQF